MYKHFDKIATYLPHGTLI